MRRLALSQALVRSTGHRWRACGSAVRRRRLLPRHTSRARVPAGLRDAGLDLSLAQRLLEFPARIAAVGPQLLRAQVACEQGVDQRQEVTALVLVSAGKADFERPSAGVDR